MWDESAAETLAGTCVLNMGPADGNGVTGLCAKDPLREEIGSACGWCSLGKYACIDNAVECRESLAEEPISKLAIVKEGRAQCSSYRREGQCKAGLAFDGKTTTGWLSDLPELDDAPYLGWKAEENTCFTHVELQGTKQLGEERFRDAGFLRVFVQVLDLEGERVYSKGFDYPTNATSLSVDLADLATGRPGVLGMEIRAEFVGFVNLKAGGLSQMYISRAVDGD